MGKPKFNWQICYCSIENRCLYIECKEHSIVCTIALIFVLPTLTPRNVNEFQTV